VVTSVKPTPYVPQPGLFTSSFDEYIKGMVRSELAAEGVPLNEPFKNPDYIGYLSRQMNQIIKNNF
jgi:hypothetical protein